jgi:pimeloyl-ACP methyl ester carboxylesterase
MSPAVRSVIGVLAGIAVAMFVIAGIEYIASLAFPPPEGLDPRNPDDRRRMIEDAPTGALLIVVAAYAIGTFIGGYVAARFARRMPNLHAALVTTVIIAGTAWNLSTYEHPAWFWAASIAVIVLAGIGAARLGDVTQGGSRAAAP